MNEKGICHFRSPMALKKHDHYKVSTHSLAILRRMFYRHRRNIYDSPFHHRGTTLYRQGEVCSGDHTCYLCQRSDYCDRWIGELFVLLSRYSLASDLHRRLRRRSFLHAHLDLSSQFPGSLPIREVNRSPPRHTPINRVKKWSFFDGLLSEFISASHGAAGAKRGTNRLFETNMSVLQCCALLPESQHPKHSPRRVPIPQTRTWLA
jgi:hypothetical protein